MSDKVNYKSQFGRRVLVYKRYYRSMSGKVRHWYTMGGSYNRGTEGMIVGFRTIYDTEVEYHDGWPEPTNVKAHRAALVAFNHYTKHVLVPMDGYELIEEGDE